MEPLETPHYTEAGTLIHIVWRNADDREGRPRWGTPAPTLSILRWLCEPEFQWEKSKHVVFFWALLRPAIERRVAEDHKDLLKAAATSLATQAIDAYCEACRQCRVFIPQPYLNLPDMIEPLIDEMLNSPLFQAYAETQLRYLTKLWLSNSNATNDNPAIMIANDNEMTAEEMELSAIQDFVNGVGPSPKVTVNRVLDIIALYKDPKDRISYRPLETLLTGASRVLYVIENRAY